MTASDLPRRSQMRPPAIPATLSDVLAGIGHDRRLHDHQRKAFAGAIRTVCSNLSRAPEAVPAALRDLDQLLRDVSPAARGRSRKTIANVAGDAPSPRPYVGLPDLSYPLHDRDTLVTACGRICMHRKKISISYTLAGQRVGIKEVDEGIWIVSFMQYDLGYIDLEQKTP